MKIEWLITNVIAAGFPVGAESDFLGHSDFFDQFRPLLWLGGHCCDLYLLLSL